MSIELLQQLVNSISALLCRKTYLKKMTSKDIQKQFIDSYLKPTLKAYGYKTSGQTWWKNMGDFFIVINLQNSQYNSKTDLSFCLNIGIALTEMLKDKERKKATYFDIATKLREDAYLSEDRIEKKRIAGGWLGYLITDKTDLSNFVTEFKIDLEDNILPTLSRFITLKDCLNFYKKYDFWGKYLERIIEERGMKII